MTRDLLPKILGRPEDDATIDAVVSQFRSKFSDGVRVMITGGDGSIGRALSTFFLREGYVDLLITDINSDPLYPDHYRYLDVLNSFQLIRCVDEFDPDIIIHLAASKYATLGEENPSQVAEVNIVGTENVCNSLSYSRSPYNKVVLSSTCKAIEPETCYGASKLISERIVLNAGGSVARFYNVVQSQGNVFEIWDNAYKNDEFMLVTNTYRYFISVAEACVLVLYSAMNDGRFSFVGELRSMINVFLDLYSDVEKDRIRFVSPRRGDRVSELLHARNEKIDLVCDNRIYQVKGTHDILQ